MPLLTAFPNTALANALSRNRREIWRGTADFLHKLSMKLEPWDTRELDQLRAAARMGPRAYEQLYFELRAASPVAWLLLHHWQFAF